VTNAQGVETTRGYLPPSIVDPKATAGRKILIVSTVDQPARLIDRHVGRSDAVKVVIPVVRQGILGWLANDERAFAHAQAVADQAASGLPGEAVAASAGEADLELAVRDALATFAADEIILCIDSESYIESFAVTDTPRRRSIGGIPVRVVVEES
jgi:hypothetical protein